MMSPENIPPPENHATANGGGTQKTTIRRGPDPPQQPPLKCPRCDSSNTKFCYYNNYNLTQPRYFCKTCKRYWTRGGALRNIPIGGGCRKSKKLRTYSSSTTSFGETQPMEFILGGISLPRLHPAPAEVYTQFSISSEAESPGTYPELGLDIESLNYPTNASTMSCGAQSLLHTTPTITTEQPISISSIESLSSINQEMHWTLQQQRLAMIYGPSSRVDDTDTKISTTYQHHQEITHDQGVGGGGAIDLFKNLEMNNTDNSGGNKVGQTEWLFSPGNYSADDDNILLQV